MLKQSLLIVLSVVLLFGLTIILGLSESRVEERPAVFGTVHHAQMAKILWTSINGYRTNWNTYPGLESIESSKNSRCEWVKCYINDIAKKNADNFPFGSIIVRECFGDKNEENLETINVMIRLKGYDRVNQGWFCARYLPDGNLDKDESGVPLAGRLLECGGNDTRSVIDDFVFAGF